MKKTITDELLSIKFPNTNNIFLKEKNIKKIDQGNKSINIEIELNFVAKKRLNELQQLIEKKISSTQGVSSAASDVYKRQNKDFPHSRVLKILLQ